MKKILYIVAACGILFTACEKGKLVETTEYEKVAPGDPKYSYVKLLNLTTSSPIINYYMDGPKFSSGLSSTGIETAGFGYNGLFPDLGYAVTNPGTHQLTAKIVPKATVDPGLQILDKQIITAPGKYYTIVNGGTYDVATKTIPTTLVLEDVKPALDTSKVFVRLVNFYNNGPTFDLHRDSISGKKLASNVSFGKASDFIEVGGTEGVGGGSALVKFFFKDVATGASVNTGSNLTLTKGRAYTIYMRGAVGITGFPFTVTFYTTFY